jgi:hypothetical protein
VRYLLFLGKHYVVDVGYPNCISYLAPYKGERYHLPEWHRGVEPKTPKERFNRIHTSIHNVIEKSFAVWKNKWQILYKMLNYPMWKQKMIVVATMILYNYVHEHASGNVNFECVERDEDYEPTILERYNKYVVPLDTSTPLSNAPTMDNFRDKLATTIFLVWN